ncbi:MAG TPA: hypothetical protein VMJ75_17285 [Candidatus Acidoferrales bacterium]|nr:hypothetical protein [Candidatus Acidoferrales bacterium]
MLSRFLLLVCTCTLAAQPVDGRFYRAMRWRQIGPFRAGRVTEVAALKDFDAKALRVQGAESGFGGGGGRGARQAPTFATMNRSLGSLATVIDGQDAAPTPAMQTAYEGYCRELASAAQSWNELVANLNAELAQQSLGPVAAAPLAVPACK